MGAIAKDMNWHHYYYRAIANDMYWYYYYYAKLRDWVPWIGFCVILH